MENNEVSAIATPKLGIIKGIFIILFGMLVRAFYGLSFTFDKNLGAFIWGWIILALCLWRGIIAIKDRKVKRVSHWTIGIWVVLVVGVFILSVWARIVDVQWALFQQATNH